MSLDGIDGNHEIVAESRVAEERAVFWIATADAADERCCAQDQHEACHKQRDGLHFTYFEARSAGCVRLEVGIEPLHTRPKEAEPGLNGGAKIRLGRGHF